MPHYHNIPNVDLPDIEETIRIKNKEYKKNDIYKAINNFRKFNNKQTKLIYDKKDINGLFNSSAGFEGWLNY